MRQRIIVVAVILLMSLLPTRLDADKGHARVFFYGDTGSKYLGSRHASSHWGQTPNGWPEVVDLERYGIATSDHTIPFGTELCLEVIEFPAWAEDEFSSRIGEIICGTVVDRMPLWVNDYFGPSLDVWSALAKALYGPDYRRIGTITVRITLKETLYERIFLLRKR